MLTLYIANRAFGGLRKFSAIYQHRQIVDLAFKNEKFKNKIQRFGSLTPRQYLIDKRIEKSKEHLINGMSVTETCFAVGFESLGSFSTLFKTKTGKSPTEFQKEQLSRSKIDSKFGTLEYE